MHSTVHRWIVGAVFVFVLSCPAQSAATQSASPTLAIKASIGQSQTQNVSSFVTEGASNEFQLRVTADKPGWWFVRFESIPQHVEVRLPEGAVGTAPWIPFKGVVTFSLHLGPAAASPLELGYLTARIPDDQPQPANFDAARQFAQQQSVKIEDREHYLKLFWQTDRPTMEITPSEVHVWTDRFFEVQMVTIKGDSLGWSFVRLPEVSSNVKISLSENLTTDSVTLSPGSDLTSQQWFGFRNSVTLTVSLKNPPLTQQGDIKLLIQSGQANLTGDDRGQALTMASRNEVVPVGGLILLPIVWEPVSLTGIVRDFFTSFWGTLLLIAGLLLLAWSITKAGVQSFRARQERRARQPTLEERVQEVPPSPVLKGTRKRTGRRFGLPSPFAATDTGDSPGQEPSYHELENRIKALTELVAKATSAQQARPEWSSPPIDFHQAIDEQKLQLEEIHQRITSLERLAVNSHQIQKRLSEIELAVDDRDIGGLSPNLEQQVTANVTRQMDDLKREMGKQSQLVQAQITGLEQAMSQLLNKLREQQAHFDEQQKKFEEHRREAVASVKSASQAPPPVMPPADTTDRLYARLLGIIFGGTVEELSRENFEQSLRNAEDTLNRFFQEEIPLSQNLKVMSGRAGDIVTSLDELVTTGSSINKEAYGDLRMIAERARRAQREVSTLQSQLQNRELRLDLQIQVSTTPGGHSIFLEEMGRTVKQAIDRFTDPQAYVERLLDRLVIGDLMEVVDLCERDLAPPGHNPDLDQALKSVFQAAKLKAIEPISMEPFLPVEHTIVELVSGGRSQAVARLVKRGFYYNDQVVRKADVAVYK